MIGKPKYYSLKEIKKRNATYNVIFGERSNGKTYALLVESIKQFMVDKSTMVYLRRWKEDVIGRRAKNIYQGLINNNEISNLTNNKYTTVIYNSGEFYLANYGEDDKPIYNKDDLLGYSMSLSETEHNKSSSYPTVKTIVFDEFLSKGLYLQDEFVLFINTVSTIVRKRTDVSIYLLGNTVNRYCPYFAEMGLDNIKNMKQGSIDVYKYGDTGLTVAVEYCKSLKNSKENNFYFAFNNPKLEMITKGAWELNIYPHLPMKYKPKNVLFTYFIEFNDELFQCEIVKVNHIVFTYIHEKTTELKNPTKDLIYSFDKTPLMNYNSNILKPQNKIQTKIKWFFTTDRVFYQDNKVGDSIANFIKECKRG